MPSGVSKPSKKSVARSQASTGLFDDVLPSSLHCTALWWGMTTTRVSSFPPPASSLLPLRRCTFLAGQLCRTSRADDGTSGG